jgi:hypothetical protein
MYKRHTYPRHRKDHASEELMAVLLARPTYVFNELFQAVHENLRARNAAGCGEEMLRLRVYEKLQVLVTQGLVEKIDKKYSAVRGSLLARATELAHVKAAWQQRHGAVLSVE